MAAVGPETTAAPDYGALTGEGHVFVWLDAAYAEELGIALADADRVWPEGACAYRLTGWNSAALVEADPSLLERLRQQDGLASAYALLISRGDQATVARQLRRLRHVTIDGGARACLEFGQARELEMLSLGLTDTRWSRLLGPIDRVLWPLGDQARQRIWRTAANPVPGQMASSLSVDGQMVLGRGDLGEEEADALEVAAFDAFVTITEQRLRATMPEQTAALSEAQLGMQMRLWSQQAEDVGIVLEPDIESYLRLRLSYPEAAFLIDQPAGNVLAQSQLPARLRLEEARWLLQRAAPAAP